MAKSNHFGSLAAAAGTLVAVGLVVLMLLMVEAGPAEATFPGKNGYIAYSANAFHTSNSNIYRIYPTGLVRHQVTTSNEDEFEPSYGEINNSSWTASQHPRIAYRVYDATGGDWEIYTLAHTGGPLPVKVTYNNTDEFEPCYRDSPFIVGFGRIAYRAADPTGGDWEIYTRYADFGGTGSPPVNVTKNTTYDANPEYSPDGSKIAYQGFDGVWDIEFPTGDWEIYKIGATGGTPINLTNNNTDEKNPSYAPDGTKIAYQGFDGSDWDIYMINTDGTGKFAVTHTGVDEFEPTVSPDGTTIAYRGYDATGGDWEIYKIGATGGTPINVTKDKVDNFHPSWGVDPPGPA